MKRENIFIRRPVMATAISIAIVVIGLIALESLPIEQYPDIAPPTIMVSATYPGASAEAVRKSVIVPLEEQINGVENMTYMVSTATDNGSASITVYFKQGSNSDMAQVNVQNRVSQVTSQLPAEVTQLGVSVNKRQTSMLYIGALYSSDNKYDANFISNYVKINVVPALQRINGIGNVTCVNSGYAMRIWLKPDVMAQYNLQPTDINAALENQNLEASTGSFGENSENSYVYTLKYKGRLETDNEFANIVIKSLADGNVLRLKDVADIELGAQSYTNKCEVDGHPGVMFMVFQTAGSNATEIINSLESKLREMEPSLPTGLKFEDLRNSNDFLYASIEEVVKTLLEALLLVILVVYFFLQDFKSTLIPAISVIVSLVGTFACMTLFGFSLNLLTLFALVLAIGTVVDDAIIVVEAVQAKFESGIKSPVEATSSAMGDVTAAIVSCTLVFMAVFIPVTFTGGTSAIFYKQFGLTMASAVGISCLNALTLSPALCALLLKPKDGKSDKKNINYYIKSAYSASFGAVIGRYKRGIQFFFKRKWMITAGICVALLALIVLFKTTKTGLVPDEDTGTLFVDINTSPGSNLAETSKIVDKVEAILKRHSEIQSFAKLAGYGMVSGEGSSNGGFILKLKNWSERKGNEHSSTTLQGQLTMEMQSIKEASCLVMAPGMIPGYGLGNAVEMYVEDKNSGDMTKFNTLTQNFLAQLGKRPEVMIATTSFSLNFPQYEVNVDAAQCSRAGLSTKEVLSVLGSYCGGSYASTFNRFSKIYRVIIEANPKYRLDENSLNNLYIRTSSGEMASLGEFISLKRVFGPKSLNRFNLFNSIDCNVMTANGYSSGQTLKAIKETADQVLPSGYGYEFSGMSREQSGSSNTVLIWLICFAFIYLILASLYESYWTPLAVILAVPFGLMGSMLCAKIFGLENNIYLQVGMIMLIGLLGKTAILITEYAETRRKAGMPLLEAAYSAAVARLRPILMTVLCMAFGLLPLVVATGAGANGEQSIGVGTVGGIIIGTLALLFVVPVLFIQFRKIQEKLHHNHEE